MAGVKDDWRINTYVKAELVKRWIDTAKLRIGTIKGVVQIRGVLVFTGKAKDDADVPIVVVGKLKTLELAILAIPGVKGVQFNLDGWKKLGGRWNVLGGQKDEKK